MTVNQIYQFVLDQWRKDHKGVVLPPDVFNNWIQFVSLDMFNGIVTQAESMAAQGNVDIADVIFQTVIFGNFIKDAAIATAQDTIGGLTIGYIPTPADCKLPLGLMMMKPINLGVSNIITKKSPLLKTKYRASVLNGDVGNNPVYFVEDGRLEFIPNDLTDLILTYMRTPAAPYFDFCMSSSDQVIFMPVGSHIDIVVNGSVTTNVLYDVNGVVLASDVSSDKMTASTYLSQTIELDWDETQHEKIANLVAEKLGINLRIQK